MARAHEALARGDVVAAYDLATEAGEPTDGELAYIEVRALAGMGDWRNALRRYEEAGVGARGDVDSLALRGRLLKDAAFAAAPGEAKARFAEACAAYAAACRGADDYYAAINAAATAALAGAADTARHHAEAALAGAIAAPVQDYWAVATRAEALLLLGRADEAEDALVEAAGRDGASIAARASTFRQFTALLASPACSGARVALDPIRPPQSAHFAGHMFVADAAAEARIAAEVAQAIRAERIGWAFGALACGADIVIAETCLALGVELHAVLPFDEEDFLDLSVRPGGPGWEARYRACTAAASRTYVASAMRYVDDDNQFAFGSEVAMGLARLRATQLGGEAVQMVVWDEAPAGGVAGTGADVRRWRETGGRTVRIDGASLPRARGAARAGVAAPDARRALRVMVFTDFKGFSQLPEEVMPRFAADVMGRCAKALESRREQVLCRNTWGDALYLAFGNVRAAAGALVDVQQAVLGIDFGVLGIPASGGMRIAAHYGSVYELDDPVTGAPNLYGTEVSRAARVEPITPPGQVWVTEPMAAAVEMACGQEFACRYVGRIALAKAYGTERIYRLERRNAESGGQ
ncbi:MAG: hypothetical protein B7Z39_02415 [Novosphingobium sp. 12-64-8]|nr:MAG: hypothetical protein B7Z39_02415 [Novosphingobium sp. 12-64-8]